MRVVLAFNDTAMKAARLRREDVVFAVKEVFSAQGLPCVAEELELVFDAAGRKDD